MVFAPASLILTNYFLPVNWALALLNKVWSMEFKYLRRLVPSWVTIRALGKNKILNTSYIWIVLVPIIAKLLEKAPEVIKLEIFGAMTEIPLELPFSWGVFYFSAVCFFFASIIFILFCPAIIKRFADFSDFLGSGESGRYFLKQEQKYTDMRGYDQHEWKSILNAYVNSKYSDTEIRNLLPKYRTDIIDSATSSAHGSISRLNFSVNPFFVLAIPREELSSTFSFWTSAVENTLFLARFLSILLYILGFALMAIVLIQNFIYVWQIFFNT